MATIERVYWQYKLPGEETVNTLDSARARSYGITLDPADVEAAWAMCLHMHGCFPAAIWIQGDVA